MWFVGPEWAKVSRQDFVGFVYLLQFFLGFGLQSRILTKAVRVPDLNEIAIGLLDLFGWRAESEAKDPEALSDRIDSWSHCFTRGSIIGCPTIDGCQRPASGAVCERGCQLAASPPPTIACNTVVRPLVYRPHTAADSSRSLLSKNSQSHGTPSRIVAKMTKDAVPEATPTSQAFGGLRIEIEDGRLGT